MTFAGTNGHHLPNTKHEAYRGRFRAKKRYEIPESGMVAKTNKDE